MIKLSVGCVAVMLFLAGCGVGADEASSGEPLQAMPRPSRPLTPPTRSATAVVDPMTAEELWKAQTFAEGVGAKLVSAYREQVARGERGLNITWADDSSTLETTWNPQTRAYTFNGSYTDPDQGTVTVSLEVDPSQTSGVIADAHHTVTLALRQLESDSDNQHTVSVSDDASIERDGLRFDLKTKRGWFKRSNEKLPHLIWAGTVTQNDAIVGRLEAPTLATSDTSKTVQRRIQVGDSTFDVGTMELDPHAVVIIDSLQ